MRKSTIAYSVAAALPFLFASNAIAQATAQPQSNDGYTLQGSTVKPAATPSSAANYEIKGTSFSGATQRKEAILTIPVEEGAAAYKTESGIYLYPTVFVGFGSNDNVQSSSVNQISSSFVNVAPELVAEMRHKGDRYTALVSVNNVNYANSSSDNYTHSEISVAGDNYFTNRARAGWSVGQSNSTDPRGSNNRPISAEPDKWHNTALNARLIYGAPEAPGRIEVDLGNQNKVYDNNRVNTAVADYDLNSMAARVFYRVGSKTLALGEFRLGDTQYKSALATDSNVERRYYAGLTWEATAATTGIVKVGTMSKDFGKGGKNGFSGSSWEAAVRWLPMSYSAFDLQTSRATADSTGFGDFSVNTATDLSWNHQWTRSLTTTVSAGVLNTDFGGTTRKDTANNFSATMNYAVLRWLKIGLDVASTDNSSNVDGAAFKRTVGMLTLNASL